MTFLCFFSEAEHRRQHNKLTLKPQRSQMGTILTQELEVCKAMLKKQKQKRSRRPTYERMEESQREVKVFIAKVIKRNVHKKQKNKNCQTYVHNEQLAKNLQ